MRKLRIHAQPACPDCGAVVCDCANDHLPVPNALPAWLDGTLTVATFLAIAGCAALALWSV